MESFGLFNFLKSAFFPSAATDRGNSANSSPESGSAPAAPASPTSRRFSESRPGRTNANKPELAPEAPPRQTMPVPPSDDVENNRFVALMERHERLSKSIGKKAPRR